MRNYRAVEDVSRHLSKICESIQNLACSIEMYQHMDGDLEATYETLMLDKLEHLQMLTLKLTELITSAEERSDSQENLDEGGGAFFAGELDDVKRDEAADDRDPTSVKAATAAE